MTQWKVWQLTPGTSCCGVRDSMYIMGMAGAMEGAIGIIVGAIGIIGAIGDIIIGDVLMPIIIGDALMSIIMGEPCRSFLAGWSVCAR